MKKKRFDEEQIIDVLKMPRRITVGRSCREKAVDYSYSTICFVMRANASFGTRRDESFRFIHQTVRCITTPF